MAIPTIQAVGSAVSGIGGTISPAWPTHQTDDIAFCFVESTGGQAVTLNTANGFVEVTNSPSATGTGTAGTRVTTYWARATSASMSAPVINAAANHSYAVIVTVRGAILAGDPWDITGAAQKASASTSASAPSVNTTLNDCLILSAISRDNDNAAAAFSSWANASLSSVNEEFDAGTIDGNGGGLGIVSGGLATAGASGTTTATVTSSINASFTIAIKPAQANDTVDCLIVAGGGGARYSSTPSGPDNNGGGGGQVQTLTAYTVSPGSYAIVVGGGGPKSTGPSATAGGNSSAFGTTSTGGSPGTNSASGASGSGSAGDAGTNAGGGGQGGVGVAGDATNGGNGGAGVLSAMSGTSLEYGHGGGGGATSSTGSSGSNNTAKSGTGGLSGGYGNGNDGLSGSVYVRFATAGFTALGWTASGGSASTSGSFTIHEFTANDNFVISTAGTDSGFFGLM